MICSLWLSYLRNIIIFYYFNLFIFILQRVLGTKTAFMVLATMSGLKYTENLPNRRVLINLTDQEVGAVEKFYALAICYMVFKNNLRVSPFDFLDHLACLSDLGRFYNGDRYEGDDNAFEK